MKIALCLFGLPRYSEYVLNTLKQNLLNLYDVDVYAHFWWSENMIGEFKHREFYDVWESDTVTKLEKIIPFKKLKVEPQIHFDLSNFKHISLEPDLKHLSKDICKDILFSNKSKWYSTYQSYLLIDNPTEYDFIIITRLDCDYSKPIDVSKLTTNKLYLQDGYRSGNNRKYTDVFAIGCPVAIKYYAEIYKHTDKYHVYGVFHLHTHFQKLLNYDILIDHEVYPFGVWILHPSLYTKKRQQIYLTNKPFI